MCFPPNRAGPDALASNDSPPVFSLGMILWPNPDKKKRTREGLEILASFSRDLTGSRTAWWALQAAPKCIHQMARECDLGNILQMDPVIDLALQSRGTNCRRTSSFRQNCTPLLGANCIKNYGTVAVDAPSRTHSVPSSINVAKRRSEALPHNVASTVP